MNTSKKGCLYIAAALVLAMLQACASNPSTHFKPVSLGQPKQALALLGTYHQSWRGTPYRLGGASRSGIDCSAFVQQAYHAVYGVALPRTTALQKNVGKSIKGPYKTGDLILFKTQRKTRHIGIYLDRNRFLHASTSAGVTISSLDTPYWRQHFWQARRL